MKDAPGGRVGTVRNRRMFPEFASFPQTTRTIHPGTITFVGTDGRQRVELAEHLPDWLKFAPGPDGALVPVVRVVRLQSEQGYSLRSYSAEGRLLWVGLMVPTAPPSDPISPFTGRPVPPRQSTHDRPAAWDRAPFASGSTGWF